MCRGVNFLNGLILVASVLSLSILEAGSLGLPRAVPPLVEYSSMEFQVPYAPNRGNNGQPLAISSTSPTSYATSGNRLFVVRSTDGVIVDEVVVDTGSGFSGRHEIRTIPANATATERLLVWNSSFRGIFVFSLADPEHPEFVTTWVETSQVRFIHVLPGEEEALVMDAGGATFLMSMRDGSRLFELGRSMSIAVSRNGEDAILARLVYSSTRGFRHLVTYRWKPGVPPVVLFQGDVESNAFEVSLSSRGRHLILPQTLRVDGGLAGVFDLYDVNTGNHLSRVRPIDNAIDAVVIDAADSTLVTFGRNSMEFFDLTDPERPTPDGTLALELAHPSLREGDFWDAIVRLSEDGNTLYAAVQGEAAIVTIDSKRRSEIGRHSVSPVVPTSITLREGVEGAKLAVSAARIYDNVALERGGLAELRFLDADNAFVLRQTGRTVRATPQYISHLGWVGKDLVVAVDVRRQAVALVRGREGAVLDVTGYGYAFSTSSTFSTLDAVEGLFTLRSPHNLELFSTRGGRIRLLYTISRENGFISDTFLHADGSLLYRVSEGGETVCTLRSLDGSEVISPTCGKIIDRSESGNQALIKTGFPDRQLCLIDLSDPTELHESWCRSDVPYEASFFSGGEKVFQSFLGSGSFTSSILSIDTGEPLGAESEPDRFWIYGGFGTLSESPSATRALRWRRLVFSPFEETLLYDLDGDTPRLIATGQPRWGRVFWDIYYTPRDNGGWIEIRSHEGYDDTEVYLGDPDGTETLFEVVGETHRLPVSLGRGRFATTFNTTADHITARLSFWVDPIPFKLKE